ncbi:MAG: DUF4037 domain-containing protein [Lachnospiraceae bacterium]|nr:DUF4037 domain-containing protein [Lachnospiraceae bacterium]
MKGLELSEEYYNFYGKSMIHEKFPMYEKRIAVGLVGQGSECLGFDDDLSTDHDFGPSFCMWLNEEDYKEIGSQLAFEYEQLPKDFAGVQGRVESTHGGGRVGVHDTHNFYYSIIGRDDAPKNNMEWLFIPESRLAVVTNGKVFRDDLGEFTAIREQLQAYYPEDVRIKKIVARAATMAQSGQYNYARCMRRGETVAAYMSLSEFVKNTISMVYLLNKRYTPFYKWMHHGMNKLPILPEVSILLKRLCEMDNQKKVWEENEYATPLSLNLFDKNIELIEEICVLIVEELNRQDLSEGTDPFLENHTIRMMNKIEDKQIKALQIMEG